MREMEKWIGQRNSEQYATGQGEAENSGHNKISALGPSIAFIEAKDRHTGIPPKEKTGVVMIWHFSISYAL